MFALLLAAPALAESTWFQVPAHPLWVELPAGWRAAADAAEPLLVGQGPRGGTVFLLASPADSSDTGLASVRRRLESEWREVEVKLTDGRLQGAGRLGEARIGIDSRSLRFETSAVSATHGEVVVHVVAGLPKGTRLDLDAVLGSVRVRWDRPGGGWAGVPHSGVQAMVPVDGWRKVVNEDVLSLKSIEGKSELQVRVMRRQTADAAIGYYRQAINFPFLTWDDAPKAWAPPKGVGGKGLELSATGESDGLRFNVLIRTAPIETAEGPATLILSATSEGVAAVDPAAPRPPALDLATLRELTRALRPAP